jgi:hypothetical protein
VRRRLFRSTGLMFGARVAGAVLALANILIVSRPGLESTVPGLHFLGAPAMRAFGPVMRFVCGTWFSSRELTHRVASGATRRAWCSW